HIGEKLFLRVGGPLAFALQFKRVKDAVVQKDEIAYTRTNAGRFHDCSLHRSTSPAIRDGEPNQPLGSTQLQMLADRALNLVFNSPHTELPMRGGASPVCDAPQDGLNATQKKR